MSDHVALIFIFNHRYDRNIEILEGIYKTRFTHIYHLVPFYRGSKTNVIPVYENSFYFQGYMAQGLKHFFNEQFEHYLFVGDDLLLNPLINEANYKEYFNLSQDSSYIPEIFNLHNLTNYNTLRFETFSSLPGKKAKPYWWRINEAANYSHEKEGAETSKEMPSFAEAEALINKHGYSISRLGFQDLHGGFFPFSFATHETRMRIKNYLKKLRRYKKHYSLSYPLVGSYSDIVIVAGSSIKTFCHYCGVFAANELFVEFAVPTALLLSCDQVVTEPSIGKRGDIYWTYSTAEAMAYEEQMQQYHYKLPELLLNFPKDKLYIHPIKLSKWSNEKI